MLTFTAAPVVLHVILKLVALLVLADWLRTCYQRVFTDLQKPPGGGPAQRANSPIFYWIWIGLVLVEAYAALYSQAVPW